MEECNLGGIRCSEVLEVLSDFIADDLVPSEASKVRAHLEGCDNCARFGAMFGNVVDALASARAEERLPEELLSRLRAALDDG